MSRRALSFERVILPASALALDLLSNAVLALALARLSAVVRVPALVLLAVATLATYAPAGSSVGSAKAPYVFRASFLCEIGVHRMAIAQAEAVPQGA